MDGRNLKAGAVGAVVRDRCGDLAAGTSTGGFDSKTPGRVGDSPIIGAGTYADNETAAISATGHGEFFIRHVVAYDITAAMKYKGLSLEKAAKNLIKTGLRIKGLRGGVIAVDGDGNFVMTYNTEGMVRGVTTNAMEPLVKVY
jgi:beta-aspartyl-peptidase (threonine type)